jgi:hypothetical protein
MRRLSDGMAAPTAVVMLVRTDTTYSFGDPVGFGPNALAVSR